DSAAFDAAMVQLTPATPTSSPVAAINATRPPALMVIASLPNCPIPLKEKTLPRVRSAAKNGNLRATPGEIAAMRFGARRVMARRSRWLQLTDATGRNRCYEPPRRRARRLVDSAGRVSIDHEFVIIDVRRNKLKDRPN